MTIPPVPNIAEKGYLTDVLQRAGVLGNGHIQEVVVESPRATIFSHITRLRLAYDSAPDAPASLILKTAHPDRPGDGMWTSGRQEVAFYSQIVPAMTQPPVPRCFDSQWHAETRIWHLLLEDLADSHVTPSTWPIPPTVAGCEAIVEAWARFHAAWWDDPRLGVSIGAPFDAAFLERLMRDLTARVERFTDYLGDRLTPERRGIYHRLLDAGPDLMRRRRLGRHHTIVHGDAHVWNCFLPRDDSFDVRLFDWDGWRIGVASGDLAYMMATHWYPERRRRLERGLLDRYHAALLRHGVTGYDRAALDADYRWSALWQITTPVWQMNHDVPAMIWWSHLERVMAAFDDLGCRELLAP